LIENFEIDYKDEENEEEDNYNLNYSGIDSNQIQSVYGLIFDNIPESSKQELLKFDKLKGMIREEN
jgi:lysine/ornithine N-monooxygenase